MTGKQRLLELLKDGQPHSHHETYALGLIAHSRAADLRAEGHDIRVWREGNTYWYQLTLREEPALAPGSVPLGASASTPASPLPELGAAAAGGPEPLTLFGDERTHYAKDAA